MTRSGRLATVLVTAKPEQGRTETLPNYNAMLGVGRKGRMINYTTHNERMSNSGSGIYRPARPVTTPSE
jgi:hypothetical protein